MPSSKYNNPIIFIFITLLIDIAGWGLIIPIIPSLVAEIIDGNISEASMYAGWLAFAYSFTQFLFAPLVGNLSDKFGRRPILLLSLLGFSINYIFMYYAHTMLLLFIGRIISGITGASITTASAYIADISTDKNRAQNFGLIGAAFGIGFIIGPTLGGILGNYGDRIPFLVAAILCFINFVYGYFILPESLPITHRRKLSLRKSNPINALVFLRKLPNIGALVLALFLVYFAAHAINATWNFFTIEKFHWSSKQIGLSLGFMGCMMMLVQGLLIRFSKPILGDRKSAYIGLLFYATGLFLLIFSNNEYTLYLSLIPYMLGGIATPSIQAIISSNVPPNEQGKLQGGLTSLMSATAIIGPLIMSWLFHFFTDKNTTPIYFPEAPFLLGGLVMLVASIIVYKSLKK